MTQAQHKRIEKYEKQEKTHCPFCSAPLKDEFGVKKCVNESCTFVESKKSEQKKLIK